jgi:hypothetical protein
MLGLKPIRYMGNRDMVIELSLIAAKKQDSSESAFHFVDRTALRGRRKGCSHNLSAGLPYRPQKRQPLYLYFACKPYRFIRKPPPLRILGPETRGHSAVAIIHHCPGIPGEILCLPARRLFSVS